MKISNGFGQIRSWICCISIDIANIEEIWVFLLELFEIMD